MTQLPMPDLTLIERAIAALPVAERHAADPSIAGPSPTDPSVAAPRAAASPAFDEPAPLADEDTKRRLDRRVRRKKAAALRDASFDWLADGFTHQEIAAARNVSVAVVRRDIARAIRARQIQTREGHAQLQIARLTKALTLAADQVQSGHLAAIGPLVKVVAALDRYHGAEPASRPRALHAAGEPVALPAPPLALTHGPSPFPSDGPDDLAGAEAAVPAREPSQGPEPATDSPTFR